MMNFDNQNISSVDVDWIYRGKKKAKRRSSSASKTEKPALNTNQGATGTAASGSVPPPDTPAPALKKPAPASSIPLSPIHSSEKGRAADHIDHIEKIDKIDKTPTRQNNTQPTTTGTSSGATSILSAALGNRPRSNSDVDPKRSSNSLTPSSSSNSTGLKRTPSNASTSSTNSTSSLKRTSSLNESKSQSSSSEKKKSLFSAFSKLKSKATSAASSASSSSASAKNSTDPIAIPSRIPKSPKSMASSVESMSPPTFSNLLNKSLSNTLVDSSNPTSTRESMETQRMVLNKNPNRSTVPIKELTDLKLRRVTFALNKLNEDPPQQIPSRRPKKGNVIVVDDFITTPSKLSIGISNESKTESTKPLDEKELKLAIAAQKRALEQSEMHAQEAHYAALRIAHEVASFKNKQSNSKNIVEKEVDEAISKGIKLLEIDKPIHLHEHHFKKDPNISEPIVVEHHNENDNQANEEQEQEEVEKIIPLDLVYTRCCHLREILPIPATIKQLRNKSSPLNVLKLLNPKPTFIDIYSFSDFIAIVPIKMLVFDNVTMDTEMIKILLSSLVHSTSLEKLSLRNVPIDNEGWKYLCKFLSRNKSLLKLDISQQKIKSDLPIGQHRSSMDWNLFTDTLILRNGIEELILNGCKIPYESFERLIDEGVSINTKRLGLAQMNLSYDHCRKVGILLSQSNIEGLDIGFNTFTEDCIKPFIKRLPYALHLKAISINSSTINNVEDAALFIRSLSKLPNLSFLDLSNLKPIFPGIIPYLNKYLPRFPSLTRLHLDSNELNTRSISIISEILPKCEHLIHVSIVDNGALTYPAAATLYGAVKSSKTIMTFDLDYDLIDETISSRIAVCLMRNMENSLTKDGNSHGDTYDDIMFDGSLIAETAGKLLDKLSTKVDDENDLTNDEFSKKFLKKKFLNKIKTSREKINKSIDELLVKRDHGELSLQGKEDLLRFYFLDSSLSKILNIFESLNDDPNLQPNNVVLNNGNNSAMSSIPEVPSPQQPTFIQPSTAVTDATPHQVALDVNGAVDVATGKPILLRNLSQTSVQAKKQEEEEGEFHKWGFFVQQQHQIYPPNSNIEPKQSTIINMVNENKQNIPFVSRLPSGAELRDAVLKASGASINELIDNVNNNRIKLDNIYNAPVSSMSLNNIDESHANSSNNSDTESLKDSKDYQEVDEAYDKLLNNLSRVRSNKDL